jgi:hypothetical protein
VITRARLWPEARNDIDSLPTTALRFAAVEAILSVQQNPWSGAELRARARIGDLSGLRRVAFDTADWTEEPRYRVVYREPDEGAVEVVAVIAVGLRERLAAYKEAAARLRAERRKRLLDS